MYTYRWNILEIVVSIAQMQYVWHMILASACCPATHSQLAAYALLQHIPSLKLSSLACNMNCSFQHEVVLFLGSYNLRRSSLNIPIFLYVRRITVGGSKLKMKTRRKCRGVHNSAGEITHWMKMEILKIRPSNLNKIFPSTQ